MNHFLFLKGRIFIIPVFVLCFAGGVSFAKELVTSPREAEFLISAKASFEYSRKKRRWSGNLLHDRLEP